MKKMVLLLATVGMMVSLTGCISQFSPVVNDVKLNEVDFSQASTWREGESCQLKILNLLPVGTASVKNAAQEAKISKVLLTDYNYQWYMFFERMCVKVYGK
ncbi:MAG: TRL domain-containing protein [Desulfuromonadaceae bacterium]|nr:TRL domain-containing protein [Desulfuromonadaceae bacterium]MDD2855682.1 TRL domain-containing protein [Desulfuromonadaceae bacterium]